ncbi:MAG TPA: type II secretion system protein GspL [Gammaproteobacteria bacterium]|nr:type II secretion system protein GspL [Gammaproteobacteria bacterium]
MRNPIYVRLPDPDTGEITWQTRRDDETATGGHGAPEELAAAVRGHDVVLLVPTEEVLLARVNLPVRNRSRLRQATPFALEEHLAEDVENLHFALGQTGPSGTPAAVVARARIEHWLAALETEDGRVTVAAVVPDVLALPWQQGRWTLLVEDGRLLVRTGFASGMAIDPADAGLLLGRLFDGSDSLPTIVDLYHTGAESAKPVRALLGERIESVAEHVADGLLACIDPAPVRALPINLRQGSYAPRREARRQWRRWRVAVLLFVLLLVFRFGLGFYHLHRVHAGNRALEARTQHLFHQTFPDVHRVVDMQVQARQRLDRLRKQTGAGSAGFLPMLGSFSQALGHGENVMLKGISYQNGVMNLDVKADKLDTIDGLKKRITGNSRFRFDIQSVNNNPHGIEARLEMRSPGA